MTPAFTDDAVLPWTPLTLPDHGAHCNICRWTGTHFATPPHVEGNHCPGCGSISRDRHLHLTWLRNWEPMEWAEVIETSPRIGGGYRDLMTRRLRYRGTDFDQRAHRADIQLDLQDIALDDDALDVVLTSHVLEHVPETDRALAELRRVLAPGGLLVLQVPILEPETIVPREPEFHGDDTPVFWRFGLDLTERLEAAGFAVDVNVPHGVAEAFGRGRWEGPTTPEFDVDAVVASAAGREVQVVGDAVEQYVLGLGPGYGVVTWTGRVPGPARPRPAPTPDELALLQDDGSHPGATYPGPAPSAPAPSDGGDELSWAAAARPLAGKVRRTAGRGVRRVRELLRR